MLPFIAKLLGGAIYIYYLLFTSSSLFNLLPSRLSLPFYLTACQDQILLQYQIKKKHFSSPFLSSLETLFPDYYFLNHLLSWLPFHYSLLKGFLFQFHLPTTLPGLPKLCCEPSILLSLYSISLGEFI